MNFVMGGTERLTQGMSRRQEKIAKRNAEYNAFMLERRKMQLSVFQANFDIGMQLYEKYKDTMPPEEIELVEKEIAINKDLLEKLKDEVNQRTQA